MRFAWPLSAFCRSLVLPSSCLACLLLLHLHLLLQRVLFICAREPMWVPSVRWSSTIADLELVGCRGVRIK